MIFFSNFNFLQKKTMRNWWDQNESKRKKISQQKWKNAIKISVVKNGAFVTFFCVHAVRSLVLLRTCPTVDPRPSHSDKQEYWFIKYGSYHVPAQYFSILVSTEPKKGASKRHVFAIPASSHSLGAEPIGFLRIFLWCPGSYLPPCPASRCNWSKNEPKWTICDHFRPF